MMFSVETDSDGMATVETWESPYTLEAHAEGYELYMEDLDEDKTVRVELEPEVPEGETDDTGNETTETTGTNETARIHA